MEVVIRPTRAEDATHLPTIERTASFLFRTIPDLAWIADADDMPVKRHLEFVARGTSWVAEAAPGQIAAFLCAEATDEALHIWELSVAIDHQRKGIGSRLISHAIAFAREARLASVTLTTFRAIPWNEPAYQRIGFVTLQTDELDERLHAILDREAAAGLPRDRRCAMRLFLADGIPA